MSTLLIQQLLERVGSVDLSKVDKKLAPYEVVGKGEKVVGVLPDHLKRFYFAFYLIGKELKERCPEVHALFVPKINSGMLPSELSAEEKVILYRHNVNHEWLDMLKDLFWIEVTNEFPELGMPGVSKGLREGWKVVSRCSTRDAAKALLEQLLDILES